MLWRPGWPDLRSSPDVVGAPAMLLRCACLSAPPGTIYDHGEIPKISSRHLSIMHGLHSYTIVLVAVDHCNFWQIIDGFFVKDGNFAVSNYKEYWMYNLIIRKI